MSVAVLNDVAIVGAAFDSALFPDAGSAYVFRYDGSMWVQEQKLFASDGQAGDHFGISVALDGNLLLVGADLGDADGAVDSGVAYVFRYDGSDWNEEQKLAAFGVSSGDFFGGSVALDNNVALVGSWQGSNEAGVPNAGSAYVFRHNGTLWTQEASLVADDQEAGDVFGWSVSLEGNVAVISSDQDDDDGSNSGSAYVFEYDGISWTQAYKLRASDASAGAHFGWSVSVSGNNILIGAPFFLGMGAGSAYLFRCDSGSCVECKLSPSDGTIQDYFGYYVSVAGSQMLVGAHGHDNVGTDAGAAYMFSSGPGSIPAISDWGLIVMVLLMLTVGRLVYTQHRPADE